VRRDRHRSAEILFERARKLKLENDTNERQLLRTSDALAAVTAIIAMLKDEFEKFPERFPEYRERLAAEIPVVLDGVDARFRATARYSLGARDLQNAAAKCCALLNEREHDARSDQKKGHEHDFCWWVSHIHSTDKTKRAPAEGGGGRGSHRRRKC